MSRCTMMTMTMGEGGEGGDCCARVMLKYQRNWEMGRLVSVAIDDIKYTVSVNVRISVSVSMGRIKKTKVE